MPRLRSTQLLILLGASLTFAALDAAAASRALITQPIDDSKLISLAGSVVPDMTPANDRGPVADTLRLEHVYLQLSRAADTQKSVDALIESLHDPNSSQFHHWLTAEQIGDRFGPDASDVAKISAWLESHGLTVNVAYRANGVIDFSGTAGAVRDAFHTEIHKLDVRGQSHMANATPVKIPAALAMVVTGITSLNDYKPKAMHTPRGNYTFSGSYGTEYVVAPGDLATIYSINPVFQAGITGKGETIVVVEDTNLYSQKDWYAFREVFGLAQQFPDGTLTEVHPQPPAGSSAGAACTNPGDNGDDSEAAIDVEYASASAPNAAIVLAACAGTYVNFGGFIALQNLISTAAPPHIVSISYGLGEVTDGPALNAYIDHLYEAAVLEGVSVFVSSGDAGPDQDDRGLSAAISGINISGWMSTPHNVSVGGTDFSDTYSNDNSTYWSSTNGKFYTSALSYVPEIPWNDSCGGILVSNYLGFAVPYGADGLCNSAEGAGLLDIIGGAGGPSQCAYGSPSFTGIVSGTCKGYAKPSYQAGAAGNPADGVRDTPDVALFASNGFWNHYYVFCYTNPAGGGVPCSNVPSDWPGAGGTSFASPIMAGIQALAAEAAGGGYQGNPNYVYYKLAAAQIASGKNSRCNSSLGNAEGPNCVFNDVTLGDIAVDCAPYVSGTVTIGLFNCYLPSGTYGVISTSKEAYDPAFSAHTAWDFPSGLGSVNAYNLVKSWPGSSLH
jgi:subtilase family serine protease